MAEKEQFGISEQLDCSDCVNHGGDWDCDHVHCRKGTDTISRRAALDALDKRFDSIPMEQTTEILLLRKDLRDLPSAEPVAKDICVPVNCISRQAALDAIKKLEKPAPTAQHLSAIFDCEDIIVALPSAQQWILATPETMPDSFETVYVTVSIGKRRYVTRGEVANGKWEGIFGGGRVVAWMPITYPKPYNGELDG